MTLNANDEVSSSFIGEACGRARFFNSKDAGNDAGMARLGNALSYALS